MCDINKLLQIHERQIVLTNEHVTGRQEIN